MIGDRNIKDLHLSDEQMQVYKELSKRAEILKQELRTIGVHPTAVDKIVNKTDLMQIDTDNPELLRTQILETWDDFIIPQK